MTPHRTRIKICGLTREADVHAAVRAGADAIGFVLYPPSPRYVAPERAAELAKHLPAFVTPVLLFVNATPDFIARGLEALPNALLQFHGDETPEECTVSGRPFMRAARIPTGDAGAGFDLLKYAQDFNAAQAILLDAHVDGYGGGGKSFDWTAFPWSHPLLNAGSRLVLSGGLDAANAIDGISRVRPWAVDVSSGVEVSKGIKDPEKIHRFVAAVRAADASLSPPA
jgi:phosphoribosylanthranilate isomerase